jgi:hypothetical protein
MKKIYLIVLVLLQLISVKAQNFEWASSGSNIASGYMHSCVTVDGRLIAGGQYEEPSFYRGDENPVFYSASGKEAKLPSRNAQLFVNCYSSAGEIEWSINSQSMIGYGRLTGVASRPDGTVVIGFRAQSYRGSLTIVNDTSFKYEKQQYGWNDCSDYDLFATIDKMGQVMHVYAVKGIPQDDYISMVGTPEGGIAIGLSAVSKEKDKDGRSKSVGYNYTFKLKQDFSIEWLHKTEMVSKSCCSFHIPSCKLAVGQDGDIYIGGTIINAMHLEGTKLRKAPILDVVTQYNQPYECYVARLSSKGVLKWVRYSEGKSILHDISVDNEQVIIGGRIQLQKKLFGVAVDTTDKKQSFLGSFDLSGNTRWMKTFNGEYVYAVSQDSDGNVFAAFRSKQSKGMKPLKIDRDTIPDTYERVVVASFDASGKYRWYKYSGAMLAGSEPVEIHNDLCGNLYFTGEMWYALPVNMALFDGAIVKGKGYGGAPIAARIRTTIPEQLVALNLSISQSIKIRSKDKSEVKNEKKRKGESSTNSNQASSSAAADTLKGNIRTPEGSCYPIPYPWKIKVFPNPSKGPITIQVDISYTDPSVSLELWSSKGDFLQNLMPASYKESGKFEHAVDLSNLAAGLYLIVLKGSVSAATERLLITK